METALSDADVAAHIATSFRLEAPVSARLIRRGFNDHYLVESRRGRWVFRVYHRAKLHISSDDEIRFELDLLEYLSESGVSVASPIRDANGSLLQTLKGFERLGALFEFARGDVVRAYSAAQAASLGETVALLHVNSDQFFSSFPRYSLGIDSLIDAPLRYAEELVGGSIRADREEFQFLRRRVESLVKQPGSYGIIHGDCHSPNIHVIEDTPTLFDFDHCAFGWRAYDLASCFLTLQDSPDIRGTLAAPGDTRWGHFIRSYASLRQPAPFEIEVLPVFMSLRAIWDVGNVVGAALSESGEDQESLRTAVPMMIDWAADSIRSLHGPSIREGRDPS